MTDLSPAPDATIPCLRCGAQSDGRQRTCEACGAPLVASASEGEREDLELEEVWRSAAAGGFDADFEPVGAAHRCPACGNTFDAQMSAVLGAVAVRDTPSARSGLLVATLRCPHCRTPGRLVADAGALADDDQQASTSVAGGPGASRTEVADGGTSQQPNDPDEISWRHPQPAGATDEEPLGEDRRFFERPASDAGGTLAEQQDLIDEEGDDIREYTGEPVETEEGWVLPQQQNVGPGNMAGGGEWPDPERPPAQPGTGDDGRS